MQWSLGVRPCGVRAVKRSEVQRSIGPFGRWLRSGVAYSVVSMHCHLEGMTPPLVGKHLPVTSTRPATIKTNKGSDDVGEVLVAVTGLRVQLTNHSRIRCTINQQPAPETADLSDGDLLAIGKQSFKVVIASIICTVCDKVFDQVDRVKAWSDGQRHICCQCLAKGVRPANLASTAPVTPDAPGSDDLEVVEDAGDHETTTPMAAVAAPPQANSDRHRQQRRMSASRLAHVDAPEPKNGLLSKMGQVFSSQKDRKRLELLEAERRALLEQAGRLALSENNGFGIPNHLYNPLLKGVQVSLRLQDFSIPAIERWRAIRNRLTQLDAEIGAARAQLGLGSDRSLALPPVPLASDQRAQQDHTFELMDGLATMELEGASVLDDQVALDPGTLSEASAGPSNAPAKSSSGRRSPRRRRP